MNSLISRVTLSHRIAFLLRSFRALQLPMNCEQMSLRTYSTNFLSKADKEAAALSAQPYIEKLLQGDRSILSRSITLIESMRADKRAEGQAILAAVVKHMNSDFDSRDPLRTTFRIGLSGPPGAGKSSLIESLGCRLTGSVPWESTPVCDNVDASDSSADQPNCSPVNESRKHRVAVLAVDPSSASTGGSLLADKTRMERLSTDPRAFIRPSPNAGHLGGVARATNESVVLCEGCGYDIVLVETVGVGQAEFKVADMVDMFVLVLPPAGGDELQGMKRGIVEVADLVLINKSDGDLLPAARRIAMEYSSGLRYMTRRRRKWIPKVMMVSSHLGSGISEFWETAMKFHKSTVESGELQLNRRKQLKTWMWGYLNEGVMESFRNHPAIRSELKRYESMVIDGSMPPGEAAELLLGLFLSKA